MKNNALTDLEIKTINDARKILKRLNAKAMRWNNKIFNIHDANKADFEQEKFNDWMDALYDGAKIDFSGLESFISLE